jgi:Na+/proline symporter
MIGIIGYKLVQAGALGDAAASVATDSEKIMPAMVMTLLNPILAGILLSGAVSAMMSTASSQLMVVSSSMTEDVYLQVTRKKIREKRLLFLNKLLTLAVGLVGFLLAITMQDTVYGLVSYAWSGIGASFRTGHCFAGFLERFFTCRRICQPDNRYCFSRGLENLACRSYRNFRTPCQLPAGIRHGHSVQPPFP